MRRIRARVEVDGTMREMVFLTNNLEWLAATIAELYRVRWQVELLFKELQQTLQLRDFYGENANAVVCKSGRRCWCTFTTLPGVLFKVAR